MVSLNGYDVAVKCLSKPVCLVTSVTAAIASAIEGTPILVVGSSYRGHSRPDSLLRVSDHCDDLCLKFSCRWKKETKYLHHPFQS